MPAPALYSARCSNITFKKAVGSSPSVNSSIFMFRIWDSDTKPAMTGALLMMVSTTRMGWLLYRIMHGWLELAVTLPNADRNSTLTWRNAGEQSVINYSNWVTSHAGEAWDMHGLTRRMHSQTSLLYFLSTAVLSD